MFRGNTVSTSTGPFLKPVTKTNHKQLESSTDSTRMYLLILLNYRSQDRSVNTALGYGLDDRGSIPGRGWDFFLFAAASRPVLGLTQPPNKCIPVALSPEVERETERSPPSSAEVNNEWSYTSSDIALSYELDYRGFESRQGLGTFLYTTASRPALGPTQPIH